jgi:hypothetical protein
MAINENVENQNDPKRTQLPQSERNRASQVKPNPSRDNKNTKGQSNEKSFDANSNSERDVEIDTAGLDRDEVNLDRSGVSSSKNRQDPKLAANNERTDESDTDLQASSNTANRSGAANEKNGTSKKDVSGQRSNQLNRNQDDSNLQ